LDLLFRLLLLHHLLRLSCGLRGRRLLRRRLLHGLLLGRLLLRRLGLLLLLLLLSLLLGLLAFLFALFAGRDPLAHYASRARAGAGAYCSANDRADRATDRGSSRRTRGCTAQAAGARAGTRADGAFHFCLVLFLRIVLLRVVADSECAYSSDANGHGNFSECQHVVLLM
jgi:hypothetical protein